MYLISLILSIIISKFKSANLTKLVLNAFRRSISSVSSEIACILLVLWKLAKPALIVLPYVNGNDTTVSPFGSSLTYSFSSLSIVASELSILTTTVLSSLHSGHSALTVTSSPPLAPRIAIKIASTSALNSNLGFLISGTQDLTRLATASPFSSASGFLSISSSLVVIGYIANSPLSGTSTISSL